MEEFSLTRTCQCEKCPWKKTVDPTEIPNGYSIEKHRMLRQTIATENAIEQLQQKGDLPVMACHESGSDYCIGWLKNQIDANNIRLRIKMLGCKNMRDIKLCGEQWESFDEMIAHAEKRSAET